jgi:arylsulfatase A-like enzyme
MGIMRWSKIFAILLSLGLFSCERNNIDNISSAKSVFIIVIDGARYSETWGDTSYANIPKMKIMSEEGVLFTNFYNNGPTYTLSGHTSLTTGNYQEINNTGLEIPQFPSVFQYWNQKYSTYYPISRIFSSKDKLSVLSDCLDPSYSGCFRPLSDCGVNGIGVGSGYRDDSITLKRTISVLEAEHPNLVLISFREPDYSAHQNNWEAYLEGIKNCDTYVYQIWNFIEQNQYYKGKTTIFITNDHGRHLDTVSDGFSSHGDTCDGCRHISLLAFGPDFKKGEVIKTERELIDIPATIADIFKFNMPAGKGNIMYELYK